MFTAQLNRKYLKKFCENVRKELVIHSANNPGFHLATALGIVELAVGVQKYIADYDDIIFDIGHQRYVFEMLYNMKEKGMFINRTENKYDFFHHPAFAGLSVASALGKALASNKTRKQVIIIGDGAFAAGEVIEGLNHLSAVSDDFVIIYNRNNVSIMPNVGYLSEVSSMKEFARAFGLSYCKISQGNDVSKVLKGLSVPLVKKGKFFVEVITKKGYGYAPAEQDPISFHQLGHRFEKSTGREIKEFNECNNTFMQYLIDIGIFFNQKAYDHDFLIFSPATPPVIEYMNNFPARYLDFGIAEQTYVTAATAAALSSGRIVFGIMFAPFLARAYSQMFDLCLSGANVTILAYYMGINPLGMYEQASHIPNALKAIPNLSIISPPGKEKLFEILSDTLNGKQKGPQVVCIPKVSSAKYEKLLIDKSIGALNDEQKGVTVISSFVLPGDICDVLSSHNIHVIHLRYIKPIELHTDEIYESLKKTKRLLVIEDSYQTSGIYGDVLEKLSARNISFKSLDIGVRDVFLNNKDMFKNVNEGIGTKEMIGKYLDALLNV